MSERGESVQFVTLGLDNGIFAVPVAYVREILEMREPFRIPDAPAHFRGLIEVRGRAVPAIDLRTRLGLQPRSADADTRILVLDVPMQERSLTLGLIADRVFEVTPFDATELAPPPDIGTAWRAKVSLKAPRSLIQVVIEEFVLANLLAVNPRYVATASA